MFKYKMHKYTFMLEKEQKTGSFKKRGVFVDFIKFMRPETSLFVTGMAVSGFLFFNPLSAALFFLIPAVFFLSASGYAINYITDREEDLVNNKKINYLASSRTGYAIVALLMLAGFLFSLFLSSSAFLVYLAAMPFVLAYSVARIKKVFLLKNLYVGFTMSLTSLVGAASGGLYFNILPFLIFPFLFGFIINLLGDIRGHEGDKSAGVKTLSVIFGQASAKKILYLIFALFFISSALLNYQVFYLMLPFLALASFFLSKNSFKKTRVCILISFMVLPFALLAIKTGWFVFAL
jgi:4-hydroxybenzoate polyprenyltransferase